MNFDDLLSVNGLAYDSKKADRAAAAARRGQANASSQLDNDTRQQFGMLEDAMQGRSLGTNLSAYDSTANDSLNRTRQAGDLAWQQQNAGNSSNVTNYLNPQMDMMLSNTMQRVQGGAGSALQSSAATKNAANAVSQQAGNLWQQAYQNALTDAQNNMNVATNYGQGAAQSANIAGQQLAADNQPAEDYLNLKNDIAMQRYAGNVALAKVDATNAGRDRSLLGSILG